MRDGRWTWRRRPESHETYPGPNARCVAPGRAARVQSAAPRPAQRSSCTRRLGQGFGQRRQYDGAQIGIDDAHLEAPRHAVETLLQTTLDRQPALALDARGE